MSCKISAMISREETQLVHRIMRYVRKSYPTIVEGGLLLTEEDLLHYGVLGLLEAKSSFDASKKIPWLAFASFRVKGAMLDHIRKLPMIKVSLGHYAKIKQLKKARGDLLKKYGTVTLSQLASKLKWSIEEIHNVENSAQVLQPIKKLGLPTSENFEKYQLEKAVFGSSTEDNLIRKELIKQLVHCLQELTENDRLILTSRTIMGTKLRELAECISCTPENIRLRQIKAEKQIQNCLEKNDWPVEKCFEVIQ